MRVGKVVKFVFNKVVIQKIISYFLLILFFFLFKDFLMIFFLTFIFAYLFLTFGKLIKSKLDLIFVNIIKNDNVVIFLKKLFSLNLIVGVLYISFVLVLFFALSDLVPQLVKELTEISNYIPIISDPLSLITSKLEEIKNINTQIGGSIGELFTKQDIDLAMQIFEKLKGAGAVLVKILISLILSYIFIIDRTKLHDYLNGIKKSNFGFFYDEYKTIVEKIVKTFGLVFQAQSIIALANATLTTIGLLVIGYLHNVTFPFIYTLAIIVFICGFIPVFGTFVSSIPILILGFSMVGGVSAVLEIVILITIIHAIEAYILNPKIVSSFIHLPVSLTFLVLIISEHLMGFVGLVIGISSFYLILELLKDADKIVTKSKIALSEVDKVENETKKTIKKDVRVSRKVDEE